METYAVSAGDVHTAFRDFHGELFRRFHGQDSSIIVSQRSINSQFPKTGETHHHSIREQQKPLSSLFYFSCRYRFFDPAKAGHHAQIPHEDASWRTCSFARFWTLFPSRIFCPCQFCGPYPTAAQGHGRRMKIACGQTIGSWVCDPPWKREFPIQPCLLTHSY
jgi:hypothetical protein